MVDTVSERTRPMPDHMAAPARDVSVPGLIKSLADDVTHHFAQEIALAKTEVASAVKDIKAGKAVPKRIVTEEGIFPMEVAAKEMPNRKY